MADVYGQLSTFAAGQVLSARAHLNPLQDYAISLENDFLGINMPFTGMRFSTNWVNTKDFDGFIRHKYNSLYYKVQITAVNGNGETYIRVNGVLVATLDGAGTYEPSGGALDISALNLTVGQFYTVQVDNDTNNNDAITWALWELNPLSLPTLEAFTDESTPTAAQWQDLSDYAAELSEGLQRPYATGLMRDPDQKPEYPFAGTFDHRTRYLAYKVYLLEPYHGGAGNAHYITFRLYVNSTLAMKLHVGDVTTADGAEYFRQANEGTTGNRQHTFESGTSYLLDLDTYPGGLSFGDNVEIYAKITTSTPNDFSGNRCKFHYLYGVPASDAALTGWTNFVDWLHGDYVYGDTTAQNMGILKGNLEALGAVVAYRNPAAIVNIDRNPGRYGKRRWRWLHYKTLDNDELEPKLEFTYRGKTQSTSLPDASDRWLALDMDSIEGLWPGTDYILTDVHCAIEDVTS